MMRLTYVLLGVALFFSACDTVTEEFTIDYKYEYFPLEVGTSITYDVDSVTYFTASGGDIEIDTSTYQLREMVVDTFRDNELRLIYQIERQRRNTPSDNWITQEILTVHKSDTKLEWTENNRRFLKMLFPLKTATAWEGNQFFDDSELVPIKGEVMELFKSWESTVDEVDAPYDVGGLSFDSTTTIFHANSENLIELRYYKEVYAKNVGLVFREMKMLDTQCIADCEGQPWEQKAEKGFILRMRVR